MRNLAQNIAFVCGMLRDLRLAAFVGGGLPQYTVDIGFVLIVDYPPGCSVHTLAGKARPRTEGWSVSSHLIVLSPV